MSTPLDRLALKDEFDRGYNAGYGEGMADAQAAGRTVAIRKALARAIWLRTSIYMAAKPGSQIEQWANELGGILPRLFIWAVDES